VEPAVCTRKALSNRGCPHPNYAKGWEVARWQKEVSADSWLLTEVAVEANLQAQLRQLDRLHVATARLTRQQIDSIPPETPRDWLEAFARGATPDM
jgi:hypothetical protein